MALDVRRVRGIKSGFFVGLPDHLFLASDARLYVIERLPVSSTM